MISKTHQVNVNKQSHISTSSLYCEKMYGWMRLCIFTLNHFKFSLVDALFGEPSPHLLSFLYISESVGSLCGDGANAQYMQYARSRITSLQARKKLIKRPGFLFECLCDQQDLQRWSKASRKTTKRKSVQWRRCQFSHSSFL